MSDAALIELIVSSPEPPRATTMQSIFFCVKPIAKFNVRHSDPPIRKESMICKTFIL